jgi:hypothetical protein
MGSGCVVTVTSHMSHIVTVTASQCTVHTVPHTVAAAAFTTSVTLVPLFCSLIIITYREVAWLGAESDCR